MYKNLQECIEGRKIKMAIQPIIDVNHNTELYQEALCRVANTTGSSEYFDTADLIKEAEERNMVDVIDYTMLEMSLNNTKLLEKSNIGLNISGCSLSSPQFMKKSLKALSKSNLSNKIVVEVTETKVPSNLGLAIKNLDALKQAGCKIAIDDFGSGFGSFLYLKNLEVDYIKVSKDFIQDFIENKVSFFIVKHLVDLCNDLGIILIAECIETNETMESLKAIGVKYMQGYLFSRPCVI